MTCRDEILEVARTMVASRGVNDFTANDVVLEMARRRSRYPKTTIRTHVTSRMCRNAPSHHALRFPDLERTSRGHYRLAPHHLE